MARSTIKLLITIACCIGMNTCYAVKGCAHKYDSLTHKEVYYEPNTMPEFPGDFVAFFMKNYHVPEHTEWQSKLLLEFIIDADGQLIGARIYNKEPDQLTKAEQQAIRVLNLSPAWKPGRCNRTKVPVRMLRSIIIDPQ